MTGQRGEDRVRGLVRGERARSGDWSEGRGQGQGTADPRTFCFNLNLLKSRKISRFEL